VLLVDAFEHHHLGAEHRAIGCLLARKAGLPHQRGIAAGVDEDLYDHAAEWRTWPGYSPQERIAAEFAERFASDHTGLRDDDDFWERCNEEFSDELLTDLALSCAMWLGMGRMLRTLDIGQTCKITL